MTEDTIIEEAKTRLQSAKAEVARLELFISVYDDLRRSSAPMRPTTDWKSSSGVKLVGEMFQAVGRAQEAGRISVTERVSREIIQSFKRPIPTQMLLEELLARGVQVGGKEPLSTLAARLSRAPTLEFKRGYGWDLKDTQPAKDEAADPAGKQTESAAPTQPTQDAHERREVTTTTT